VRRIGQATVSEWLTVKAAAREAGYIDWVDLVFDLESSLAPPGMIFDVSLVKTELRRGVEQFTGTYRWSPYGPKTFMFSHLHAEDFSAWVARRAERMLSSRCRRCGGTGQVVNQGIRERCECRGLR